MISCAPSDHRRLRIGLALRPDADWMGGYRYVLSCIDALLAIPREERPEIQLLWTTARARRQAEAFGQRVDGHAHLAMASRLGLDFVYPVKEISDAPSGVPWGGWIVDWQQRHLPDMFDAGEHATRELRYRIMAENAPVVVHSSAQAREDTRRWVPSSAAALAVLNFRATLEPEGLAGDIGAARRRYNLPPRFAIVCNQWFRHKNHPVVIEALRLLGARGVRIPCVVTGREEDHRWPDYGPSLRRRISELGLSDVIHLVGLVPRVDQVLLIRAASLVIQPSLFEGWNTTVEEARSLGKTIVLSDIAVHREQAPPDAHFFDPTDPVSLADVLERAWSAPAMPEPAREQQAQTEYANLRAEVGWRLIEIARLGIAAYDARCHDPARILLKMAREAVDLGAPGDRSREFVSMAIRGWFRQHPWRFPGFAADLLEADEATRAWVAGDVLPGMSADGPRGQQMSWSDQVPVWTGWYPTLVETVRDLVALTNSANSSSPSPAAS